MKDPLVAPLLALVGGILASHWLRFEPGELLIGIPLLVALTLLALRHSRSVARVGCWAALLLCGVLTAALHRPGRTPEIDASAHETVLLSGCVAEPPAFYDGRDQFAVELAPGARARVTLTVADGDTPPDLRYGQRVEFEARVRPVRNFQNPGAFDYQAYAARSHIYWTASLVKGSSIAIQPGRCGSQFLAGIFALRTAALNRIERLYQGNPYATGIMEATLIGESSKLEKIWTDHFRRTGTYHMLVIDGLHITVLAAFLLFLLRICFVPELGALAVASGGAWLYALVSGFNAPAVRAAGGFTFYLACRYFYRRRRLLNLLAGVAIVYLVLDPGQLFEAGFQLSFLAVAAIAALAVPLLEASSLPFSRGLTGITEASRDPRMPPEAAQFRIELRLLAETLACYLKIPAAWLVRVLAFVARLALYAYEMAVISTAIQIGLALPMAFYFHRISLSGFSANVLVVPLLGLVVPIGFVAIFTGWHFVAALAEWLLVAGQRVADWHLRFEPSWRVADPPLWLSLGFSAALAAFALALRPDVADALLRAVFALMRTVAPRKDTGVHPSVNAAQKSERATQWGQCHLVFPHLGWIPCGAGPRPARGRAMPCQRSSEAYCELRSALPNNLAGPRPAPQAPRIAILGKVSGIARWGAGAVVVVLFILLFWHPFPPHVWPRELELTAIDVGQGDSLLVAFPDGKLMLVDGGGILTFGHRAKSKVDIGEDVVSPYLWQRSIRKVDVVVLTHAHDDHAGGLPALIENFHPAELWTGATPPSEAWSNVRKKAHDQGVKTTAMRGGRSFDFGGARIEILSPPADYTPAASPKNNDSLAMRLIFGQRSFLLTGDMEKPMELRALADGRPLGADVLKVGHHGSNTSSMGPFLDAVSPTFAVISDGFENSFRHPHPQVLQRLAAHRAAAFRTDSEGLISIRTDGRRIWVETYRPPARH